MEYRFCFDEIVFRLLEIIHDGYHYGSLYILPPDSFDLDDLPILCFEADDCGGIMGIDYDSLDGVPFSEIEQYAFWGHVLPSSRRCLLGNLFSEIDRLSLDPRFISSPVALEALQAVKSWLEEEFIPNI